MADVHTKEVRSFNMSSIRSKDTKPEMLVRKFLYSNGLRYRLHVSNLPGKPDIVFRKRKLAIFINGCFWHGHKGCKYFVVPKTRTAWWLDKINGNKKRDLINCEKIKTKGYKVITIFECRLKPDKREKTLKKLLKSLI